MAEATSAAQPASINTRALSALAALLIVNSHMEGYYPRAYLAGDGLFGYALFFFIAGIGLGLSAQRDMRSFGAYYWRRIARIYPTYLLMRFGYTVVTHEWPDLTPLSALIIFVWPTENTFVGALMVDYVLLYLVLRTKRADIVLKTIAAFLLPVAGLWIYLADDMHKMHGMSLNWLFAGLIHFQMMLMGSYLALNIGPIRKYRFRWDMVATGTLFAIYVAGRLFLQKGTLPAVTYPLLFVLLAGIFYFLFQMAASYELDAIFKYMPRLARIVMLVGAATLEIYFVQERLVWLPWFQLVPFPLNIVALWAVLVPLALGLEKLITAFRRRVLKVQ